MWITFSLNTLFFKYYSTIYKIYKPSLGAIEWPDLMKSICPCFCCYNLAHLCTCINICIMFKWVSSFVFKVKVWFQNRRTKYKRDRVRDAEVRDSKSESFAACNILRMLQHDTSAPSGAIQSCVPHVNTILPAYHPYLAPGYRPKWQTTCSSYMLSIFPTFNIFSLINVSCIHIGHFYRLLSCIRRQWEYDDCKLQDTLSKILYFHILSIEV